MYNITADYHTHTRFSHGKGSIEDNVLAARKKGLKKIAITDHGFAHIGFGIRFKDVDRMRQEVQRLEDKYTDIEILLGVEANLIGLDGTIDIPEEYIDKFDIILMGFHKGAVPKSFKEAIKLYAGNFLSGILPMDKKNIRLQNTQAMIRAIERYPIKIITHPGAKIDIDTRLLAQHAAKRGVALEINASHGFMTTEYVKIALREGVSFVINSDAHHPSKVGDFAKGIEIASAAGLNPDRIINASHA
ncbi:MAG: PHP domain-containing protein [Caldicoprobacterales bacterium]|jgi:putative hydrolase|nr:PHP domain-containing protein [Clostridiales bacterium]